MNILKVRECADMANEAAMWFHNKWKVPFDEYNKSMQECLKKEKAVPQWYIIVDNENIIGGIGVIENDFHNRKDLTPNICALYIENNYRCRGIAGQLLSYVCDDMNNLGIDILYLLTDHISFYERYNWKFLCMVQGDGEMGMTRMYIHKNRK